jgi:hypothetical protein
MPACGGVGNGVDFGPEGSFDQGDRGDSDRLTANIA